MRTLADIFFRFFINFQSLVFRAKTLI